LEQPYVVTSKTSIIRGETQKANNQKEIKLMMKSSIWMFYLWLSWVDSWHQFVDSFSWTRISLRGKHYTALGLTLVRYLSRQFVDSPNQKCTNVLRWYVRSTRNRNAHVHTHPSRLLWSWPTQRLSKKLY